MNPTTPPTDLATTLGSAPDSALASHLVVEPYLHIGPDRIYNPLTDRMLDAEDPLDPMLRSLAGSSAGVGDLPAAAIDALAAGEWLVDGREDLDARFHLKYVSLEAHTVCNQACYFCPVSVAPRDGHFMEDELYDRILRQLTAFKDTLEGVSMIQYNEPTTDPEFVDRVRRIKSHGLKPGTLSNGSGLTPSKVDAILEMGGLYYLSINLSTLDRERYKRDRGKDHLPQVLRNLDYVCDKPIAETMDMVVLGTNDEHHDADFAAIEARYGRPPSRFEVKRFEVMDRAGYLPVGRNADHRGKQLAGCELIGSRPLQHLHITPRGLCVVCCQDYDEVHVVGDLNKQTVAEVLRGPAMKLMRRYIYGRDEAPDDFICRNCDFALVHDR